MKDKPTVIGSCPSCGGRLEVTELSCPSCEIRIQGSFSLAGLWGLSREELEFAATFLRCGGNIKDVQNELGISYPTVKKQLDRVIASLGGPKGKAKGADDEMGVLERLEKGELSVEEALKHLKKRG